MNTIVSTKGENVTVRAVHVQDLDSLCEIHRDSFKQGFQRLIPFYFTRLRWKLRLSSSSGEVWVAEVNGEVGGFCVIVVDEIQWGKDMRRHIFLRMEHLAALLKGRISRFVQSVKMGDDSRRLRRQGREGGFITPNEFVIIQPVAVAKNRRRLGLGKALLRWTERRARDLKRKGIRLSVESSNLPACQLYEALGYRLIQGGVKMKRYVKVLDSDNDEV